MPAERPPATRATKRTSVEGAKPATMEAGIVMAMPRMIIILRP